MQHTEKRLADGVIGFRSYAAMMVLRRTAMATRGNDAGQLRFHDEVYTSLLALLRAATRHFIADTAKSTPRAGTCHCAVLKVRGLATMIPTFQTSG